MGSLIKPEKVESTERKRLRRVITSDRRVEPASLEASVESFRPYWQATRDPVPTLVFVIPLLLLYELGVSSSGMGLGRAGADAWLRHWLGTLGLSHPFILPVSIVVGLALAQWRLRGCVRLSPLLSLGMLLESFLFAVGLVGLSRVTDLGFDRLDQVRLEALPMAAGGEPLGVLVGFLGAGIYEEAVFRLAMIPAFYGLLRCLQMPNLGANVLAVTASSLCFSLAHHAGSPGELFTWYAFIFRWLAGIYFAWIFVVRGFGVAVGTHAVYDILVGYLEWTL